MYFSNFKNGVVEIGEKHHNCTYFDYVGGRKGIEIFFNSFKDAFNFAVKDNINKVTIFSKIAGSDVLDSKEVYVNLLSYTDESKSKFGNNKVITLIKGV